MPMTWPSSLSSGPPELPWLSWAVCWMRRVLPKVAPVVKRETLPSVIVELATVPSICRPQKPSSVSSLLPG